MFTRATIVINQLLSNQLVLCFDETIILLLPILSLLCNRLSCNKLFHILFIPAKPLCNSDTVSVHFSHFCCMGICEKMRRDLAMLTYNYHDVDDC